MTADSSLQLTGDYHDFLEWKKQYEPTVEVWQSLNYFKKVGDDLKWFTKVEISKSDQFCVYFSNLVELWSEELTFEDFETKLQVGINLKEKLTMQFSFNCCLVTTLFFYFRH